MQILCYLCSQSLFTIARRWFVGKIWLNSWLCFQYMFQIFNMFSMESPDFGGATKALSFWQRGRVVWPSTWPKCLRVCGAKGSHSILGASEMHGFGYVLVREGWSLQYPWCFPCFQASTCRFFMLVQNEFSWILLPVTVATRIILLY